MIIQIFRKSYSFSESIRKTNNATQETIFKVQGDRFLEISKSWTISSDATTRPHTVNAADRLLTLSLIFRYSTHRFRYIDQHA